MYRPAGNDTADVAINQSVLHDILGVFVQMCSLSGTVSGHIYGIQAPWAHLRHYGTVGTFTAFRHRGHIYGIQAPWAHLRHYGALGTFTALWRSGHIYGIQAPWAHLIMTY